VSIRVRGLHLFFVLLQDNLLWYLPKQWYHPSGTKKERKIKGKKAKELFEKAQSKAGHTTAVTSLLFALSCDHLYTSSGLQSILEGTQGCGQEQSCPGMVLCLWSLATSHSACNIALANL
jgi:hypothetical protein